MDISVTHDNFSAKDFNPLPRKEGDRSVNLGAIKDKKISIHSLVKRETPDVSIDGDSEEISIHSLVKRETAKHGKKRGKKGGFQSTPS